VTIINRLDVASDGGVRLLGYEVGARRGWASRWP
jgi:hypothetical protein